MIFDLLQKVCQSLNEHEIKYMVSGSIALNIYAIPRMTRDIDIVLELSENKIDEFTDLFPNSYYDKNVIKDEVKRKGMFNVIDHSTGFKIDFIIRKESEYFNLAFEQRQRISEFGTELWVISLNDLIIAKLIWIQQYQSERQIFDIENLLLNPDKDIDYIKNWCNKLNLQTFNLLDNE
ncbi:MAG: nucleotidyl transferase AbiEii/AbiGii toxin family protein [Bacteroidota bacterium]